MVILRVELRLSPLPYDLSPMAISQPICSQRDAPIALSAPLKSAEPDERIHPVMSRTLVLLRQPSGP